MNALANIFKRFGLIALCGMLVVFFGLSLPVPRAVANGCYAEGSCLHCDIMGSQHGEVPKTHSGSHGCPPGAQNTTCDVEKAPNSDKANYPVAFVRVEQQSGSNSGVATVDEPSGNPTLSVSISSIQPGHFAFPAPIYLLNQSLLC